MLLVAPDMGDQPVRPSCDRHHCQLSPVTPPSPSLKVAVSRVPASGSCAEKVTTPSSSTSMTRTDTTVVTSMEVSFITMSLTSRPLPSCRVTVKNSKPSEPAVSKSRAPTALICPLDALISKRAESCPGWMANVRLSPSRSVAVMRSASVLPAGPSSIAWLLPVRNRGGTLGRGSASTGAVSPLVSSFRLAKTRSAFRRSK